MFFLRKDINLCCLTWLKLVSSFLFASKNISRFKETMENFSAPARLKVHHSNACIMQAPCDLISTLKNACQAPY